MNDLFKIINGQGDVEWAAETKRIFNWIRDTDARMIYIDLFCGFGGTTTGVSKARHEGREFALVALGINHDDTALACHKVHNPKTIHLREDIRDVKLRPIADMIAAIRAAFPWIKIVLWCSAECTHHSKAKGGDSRDADSRSLAEELYRYEEAIKPDLIQVENVVEFRSNGPLEQKRLDLIKVKFNLFTHKQKTAFGTLYSQNKKTWCNKQGLAFKMDKKKGITPWMVPMPARKGEYFEEWKEHIKSLGYTYQDKNVNSADHGAFTARVRYYGQFVKTMPIKWAQQTHTKDPEKTFNTTGKQLLKYNPVREVLDFSDTGDSLLVPGRITSPQTFKRVNVGGIKYIAGGMDKFKADEAVYDNLINIAIPDTDEGFLIKYNSATPSKDNYKHTVQSFDKTAPALVARNMIGKVHVDFLPFLLQYNNNAHLNSVDQPIHTLTQKDKFSALSFIQQRHNGNPASKVISTDQPARTLTSTGGNQELVQVDQILPFLSNYHGNGHNCHSVDNPIPAVCAADIHAIMHAEPFIYRQFTNGGQTQSIDSPAGSMPNVPKLNIISPEWIMDTSFNNTGTSVDDPAKTLLASRHHAYIVNPQYNNPGNSVDKPCPTIIARQDKKPLHLAQVQYGDNTVYGIIIYKDDCPEVRALKKFMAVYGIVDIKMRMLKEEELLPIQGFPKDHIQKVRDSGIHVTTTDAKKYIGNSQEVTTAMRLVEAYAPLLFTSKIKEVAA